MKKNLTYHKKKVWVVFLCCGAVLLGLTIRLVYLMGFRSDYYYEKAENLHERERDIKGARGKILDSQGKVLAANKTVCTVSVIHSQVTDPEKVIRVLVDKLGIDEEKIRKKVEKVSSIERIWTNVEKETGDAIREENLDGVKVDEDYRRYYPYGSLASRVLGFTGGDNQGIIGLEVRYEEILKGKSGKILTVTDARGIELNGMGEKREEPKAGNNLRISLNADIQEFVQQEALRVMEEKQAERVSILLMNPQNGEILACANVPEFDLNDPFTLNTDTDTSGMTDREKQDLLNRMWRNPCLNDTYEPGSTFKIITAAAGLEAGVVTLEDRFSCSGAIIVDDRRIRCHKAGGHGAESFTDAVKNSCNPVFITVGLRLGPQRYYDYFTKFCMKQKTGIDLPGEAATIMHQLDKIGEVELATISFGQSFQITPVRLMATVAGIINGGDVVTPHFGVKAVNEANGAIEEFQYPVTSGIVSQDTTKKMRYVLEQVVESGGGKNGYVEGYRVGGKTATSQTLPRGTGRYIASFLGFAPADDPQVMAIAIINTPQGTYYGGQIAAPVIRQLFENILPYLEEKGYTESCNDRQ